jgi:Domain of unknown function (DUF1707)
VTEDATDGRRWPVDPQVTPAEHDPAPVPELEETDGVAELLAAFAPITNGNGNSSTTNGNGNGHRPAMPPVTDEDRTTFGHLLDRAAERGLLSQSEYQIRLGELAEATSRDQMRRIVTELPAFVIPPSTTQGRRALKKPAFPTVGHPTLVGGGERKRSAPWALLAVVVAVLLITLVLFAFYADHLIRQHTNGAVGVPTIQRIVAVLS